MDNNHQSECNCINCLWQRIILNEGIELLLKAKKKSVKYQVKNDIITWIPIEETQKTLYSQSKTEIEKCINSRLKGQKTSIYPGTAQSYKWALLNDNRVWISH
jgi:hypothetical protein